MTDETMNKMSLSTLWAIEDDKYKFVLRELEKLRSLIEERNSPAPEMSKKQYPALKNAAEIAERYDISEEKILDFVASKHAPHHFIGGKGPLFKLTEFKDWFDANCVTSHAGRPLPTKISILDFSVRATAAVLPASMHNIDGLFQLDMEGAVSGVYFLCDKNECVYIGSSIGIIGRISTHRQEGKKDFERAFYLPLPAHEIRKVEGEFVKLLKPKYNVDSRGGLSW